MKKKSSKGAAMLFLLQLMITTLCGQGPVGSTANDYVKPYEERFMYGSNMGYYANGWSDDALAGLVRGAGGHTIRTTLADYFVELHGLNVRVNTFKNYVQNLEMREITNFVGEPSAAHRDNTVYPNCPQPSRLFLNLYEPIWNADGTVNSNNYYAKYIYDLVRTYGDYIRIWEVVNEPDFTGAAVGNWLTRAPQPNELVNLWGPFHSYIRMLRITWEVVKKYNPDDYVTPGGIGYYEFLDALCRYTDNPTPGQEGTVTPNYPFKGGAYFDMVSYHIYPGYTMRYWSNQVNGFVHTRTSDYAAAVVVNHKNDMVAALNKHKYDGITYPKKHFIITESNVTRRPAGIQHGTDEMQRNYAIKSLVLAQKHDIKQFYFYMVGEAMNAPAEGVAVTGSQYYSLMGLYENLKRDVQGNQKLTQLGIGMKTTSELLFGAFYDPIRTAALNLPGTIEGGAFRKQNGEHIYVLWAKALTDRSEAAVSNYTFPTALNLPPLRRYEWNNSVVPNNTVIQPSNISLTGAPIFLTPASTVVLPVDMLLFTGKRLSVSQARLTWQTAQEDAKTEYVIERSLDGTSFARIGSLPGKAAQAGASYSFVDQRATGQVYYRLSWKTVHGEKHYSKVITIAGNIPAAFRVYPNPTSDFIFIDANFSEDTKLVLVDNSGRVLGTYPPTTKRIDIRKYPAGNYVLQATGVVTKQQSNFVITK